VGGGGDGETEVYIKWGKMLSAGKGKVIGKS